MQYMNLCLIIKNHAAGYDFSPTLSPFLIRYHRWIPLYNQPLSNTIYTEFFTYTPHVYTSVFVKR